MSRYTHDIIIIGGGSAGLTAASGCAQLGLKTALLENAETGGDCLHYGCVPSKTLIHTATAYHSVGDWPRFGLEAVQKPPVSMKRINARIAEVIAGIAPHDSAERFRSLGADVRFGTYRFISPHEVSNGEGETLSARTIIIATGSRARELSVPGLTENSVTNRDMFSLSELPKTLIVIGGGPVGVELSQAYSRLGSSVVLLESAERILIKEDDDASGLIAESLAGEGIGILCRTEIIKVENNGGIKTVYYNRDGQMASISGDLILRAAGRQGNTEDLDLAKAGLSPDESGFLPTDKKLRTAVKHIYAIGDVNGRFLFTHAAGAEGSLVVRREALRLGGRMDYSGIPRVTFSDPEIAGVGFNEQQAREAGLQYTLLKEKIPAMDRARAEGIEEGFVKILLNSRNRIIGAQIVAVHGGEYLAPYLYAVKERWKLSRLMSPIFPYPVVSEIHKRLASSAYGPKLFNGKTRRLLKFLFHYKGDR